MKLININLNKNEKSNHIWRNNVKTFSTRIFEVFSSK